MKEQGSYLSLPEQHPDILSQREGLLQIATLFNTPDIEMDDASNADEYLQSLIDDTLPSNSTAKKATVLQPFLLNLSERPGRKHPKNTLYQFYIGMHNERNYYLSTPVPNDLAPMTKNLYIQPGFLNVGINPYYWMDFYAVDENFVPITNDKFTACRLKPEDPTNKINFEHWGGIEEQLLGDYLDEKNGIQFHHLLPFDIKIETPFKLAAYRIAGKKHITINLAENRHIKQGDTLRFIPQTDDQYIYEWMDVYKIRADNEIDTSFPMAASYQLLPNEHKMTVKGWNGPEKQLLVDHLAKYNNITFENLRPIKTTITTADNNYVDIVSGKKVLGNPLTIYFPPGSFQNGDRVVFIPNQDEKGYYQWLELHRLNTDAEESIGELVTSARILDGRVVQMGWNGYEIELLKEVTQGTKEVSDLVPLTFVAGNSPMFNLWKEGKKRVYFVPSALFEIQKGDTLVLTPTDNTEEIINFDLSREGVLLGRYEFNCKDKLFKQLTVIYHAQQDYFDRKTGRYTEPTGEHWTSGNRLAKEYDMSVNVIYRILEHVESQPYSFRRNMTLYKETEARRVIAEYINRKNLQKIEITPEDANDYLEGLVYGGEE